MLTVRTTAPTAPYLRAVTLSTFDGSVWQPDSSDTVPVPADGPVFDAPAVDGDITLADWTTTVTVDQLDSRGCPSPIPPRRSRATPGTGSGCRRTAPS